MRVEFKTAPRMRVTNIRFRWRWLEWLSDRFNLVNEIASPDLRTYVVESEKLTEFVLKLRHQINRAGERADVLVVGPEHYEEIMVISQDRWGIPPTALELFGMRVIFCPWATEPLLLTRKMLVGP